MSNRIYVIAGSIHEFKSYVDKKASAYADPIVARVINPYGFHVGDEVHYTEYINVGSVDIIRGLRDINGVFVGTYYDRDDIWDIITYICSVKNKDIISTLPEKHRELLKVKSISNYQYNPITENAYSYEINDPMSMPSLTLTPPMPIIDVTIPLSALSTFKINSVDTMGDTIEPTKAPPFITSIDIAITRKSDGKNE